MYAADLEITRRLFERHILSIAAILSSLDGKKSVSSSDGVFPVKIFVLFELMFMPTVLSSPIRSISARRAWLSFWQMMRMSSTYL